MIESNKSNRRNKKVILNVVYSALVFLAACTIGISLLDPSAIDNPIDKSQVGAGSFLAFGIGVVLTIVFSMWFSRRDSKKINR